MEVSRPLRIFLADDHAVVLSGLRALLADEADMEVIGDASTTRETLSKVRDLRPDLVMLDIRFGDNEDAGGIDTCRRIRSELPGTRVVMFTSYGDRESVLASVLAGADAFFTKNMGRGPLLESIRAVGRGELLLDSRVTRDVVERLAQLSRAPRSAANELSGREKEVLLLIAQGLTNKEIADKLYVSPYTARNHVIHILNKLGLSRRSQAAAEAVRLGLVGA